MPQFTRARSVRASFLATSALVAALSVSGLSFADDSKKSAREHFQQGVALFSEADFSAALVEFRAAYTIHPDVSVLYNIGETELQLQHYAAALRALEKYIAEGGTAHRAEAQEQVTTLHARVGRVALTSNVAGAEVLIDDEPVGTTPLSAPVMATIGRRKVQLTPPGGAPVTRSVDVASNETVSLTINVDAPRDQDRVSSGAIGPAEDHGAKTRIIVGWSVTGALAVATAITGALALGASSDLEDSRNGLNPNRADIDDKKSSLSTLAITTDVLAAATVVAAGVSLYWTLSRPASRSTSAARTFVTPFGVSGTF